LKSFQKGLHRVTIVSTIDPMTASSSAVLHRQYIRPHAVAAVGDASSGSG